MNLLCVRLKIVGPENIIMCPTEGIFPKTPTPQAPGNSNQASYIGLRDPTPQEIPILSVGGEECLWYFLELHIMQICIIPW